MTIGRGVVGALAAHVGVGLAEPAPFLVQFVDDELDSPAAFAFDAGEDVQDFFLLATVGQVFGGDGKTA